MNYSLSVFFKKSFEKEINDKMMYYSYKFENDLVFDYIDFLIKTPLNEFIEFIMKNYNVNYLEAADIVQFSSLEDSTKKVCSVIKEAGDKGFQSLEVGKLLENDGIERKDGAYLKYGENQAKTGCQLGLLVLISNKFFLSCLGYVFNELDDEKKDKLLRRLILRNKLVQRLIYKAYKNGKSSYHSETGFLSESTRNRRKSNVKTLIAYFCDTNECDLSGLKSSIEF